MRFDWYAATVPSVGPGALLEGLHAAFGGTRQEETLPQGQLLKGGWGRRAWLQGPYGVVATVLSGGIQPSPHVRATGEEAANVAWWLRTTYPKHRVSRVDVAIDFDGEGSWDKLTALCEAHHADNLQVAREVRGDWPDDPQNRGRTLYYGRPQSAARLRVYEKGKQLMKADPTGGHSLNWVRVELECHPKEAGKRPAMERAARMDGAHLWGLASKWTAELLPKLTGCEVERVKMQDWRQTELAGRLRSLVHQYGPTLSEFCQVAGDWEAVGRELGRRVGEAKGRLTQVRDGATLGDIC